MLIVEGSAAVGKTTLCSELVRLLAGKNLVPNLFNFRQSFTYHPLNLDLAESNIQPEVVERHLERLLTLLIDLAEHPGYILLESFHWTIAARSNGIDFGWFDKFELSIAAAGAKSVLVLASPERHKLQLLERSGADFFSIYGARYGDSEEEIIRYYQSEQARLKKMAEQSPIDSIELDTSTADAAECVLSYWES